MTGIIYGYDSIPKEWINNLKKCDELLNLSLIYEEKLSKGEIK